MHSGRSKPRPSIRSQSLYWHSKHNSVIGYCVSEGSRIIFTRQNLTFDLHLYPVHITPLSDPAWQTFHNLTQRAAQGSTQQVHQQIEQQSAPEYASSESDIDDSPCSDIHAVNYDTINQEETNTHTLPNLIKKLMMIALKTLASHQDRNALKQSSNRHPIILSQIEK